MALTVADRIKDESTISRYMQLNIPGIEPGNDFVAHEYISQFDTNDKLIVDVIREDATEQVVVGHLSMEVDNSQEFRQNAYTIVSKTESITIEEPEPQSIVSKYNAMSVLIDRDGHTFLFDYTEGNNRTFLTHPTGTYFSIDNDGSWIIKTTSNHSKFVLGDDNTVITGNENKKIKGDSRTQIVGTEQYTVTSHADKRVGGSYIIETGDDLVMNVNGDRIATVSGLDVTNIAGSKEQNIQGFYILRARNTILFDAPRIEMRGDVVTTTPASFKEEIGGSRDIKAQNIILSSMNDFNIGSGGSIYETITGKSEEKILGATLLGPAETTKLIDVKVGGIIIKNIFSSLLMNGLTPGVSLNTILGYLDINVAGIVELDGTLIKIGSGASEPMVMGTGYMQWTGTHSHPTGVGPSGPPLEAADIINHLSKTVFVKG